MTKSVESSETVKVKTTVAALDDEPCVFEAPSFAVIVTVGGSMSEFTVSAVPAVLSVPALSWNADAAIETVMSADAPVAGAVAEAALAAWCGTVAGSEGGRKNYSARGYMEAECSDAWCRTRDGE